jgi:argininosuccinate lyase
VAYAKALSRRGLLSADELSKITSGLHLVEKEWEDNKFEIKASVDETFIPQMNVVFPN